MTVVLSNKILDSFVVQQSIAGTHEDQAIYVPTTREFTVHRKINKFINL